MRALPQLDCVAVITGGVIALWIDHPVSMLIYLGLLGPLMIARYRGKLQAKAEVPAWLG